MFYHPLQPSSTGQFSSPHSFGHFYQWPSWDHLAMNGSGPNIKDYGKQPLVLNITSAANSNQNFRTALWTGDHLQITLMSLQPGEDIGLEIHPDVDQFIRIEQGMGIVQMGDDKNRLNFVRTVFPGYIIVIPAGKWHNLTNTGPLPLKLYSIYAPPNHPHGTIHRTKKEALLAEKD